MINIKIQKIIRWCGWHIDMYWNVPLIPNLEKELQTFRSEVVLSVGQIVSCLFWPLTPYNLSGAGSSSAGEAQDVWIKIFLDYNIVQKSELQNWSKLKKIESQRVIFQNCNIQQTLMFGSSAVKLHFKMLPKPN